MKNKTVSYLIAIVYITLIATLGGIFTSMGVDMLDVLTLPTMWIGGTVISIVWTVIYIALALYLILLIASDRLTTRTIILVVANGICNVLWCGIFFTAGSLLGGVVIIVINAVLAILLAVDAVKTNPYYAFTVIYPLWVTIATTLNLAVWILN